MIRTPGRKTFWRLGTGVWTRVELLDHEDRWVTWDGRTWFCKRGYLALTEIAGYQLAEHLGLPVQPWLAFVDPAGADIIRDIGEIGLLVERFDVVAEPDLDLDDPDVASRHPGKGGLALALGILNCSEWPVWLCSEDLAEVRLIDLEFTGPGLFKRAFDGEFNRWWMDPDYGVDESALAGFHQAHAAAHKLGLLPEFSAGLRRISTLDFRRVIDLSGHPEAAFLEGRIVQGFGKHRTTIMRFVKRHPSH